jgi:hypothetical protein
MLCVLALRSFGALGNESLGIQGTVLSCSVSLISASRNRVCLSTQADGKLRDKHLWHSDFVPTSGTAVPNGSCIAYAVTPAIYPSGRLG